MVNLRDACVVLRDEISEQFDLGPGDAETLFRLIWEQIATKVDGGDNLTPRARQCIEYIEGNLL